MIPSALIEACERNEFVWHREFPEQIDLAFSELDLPKKGQLFEFTRRYCLQFVSEVIPFQLMDIVEEDGVSENVLYARDELGIDTHFLPISSYEAESIYVVNIENDNVVLLTTDDTGSDWKENIISDEFYNFMIENLK